VAVVGDVNVAVGGFASAVERATLPFRADLSQLAGAGDTMCAPSPNKYG
jgi:hypothetical protein